MIFSIPGLKQTITKESILLSALDIPEKGVGGS
jgi:hypothetical protein